MVLRLFGIRKPPSPWAGFQRLTFELRRDQRQDAKPGPVNMYAYHRPGLGGLPLGLASNEGLGRTGGAPDVLDVFELPEWLEASGRDLEPVALVETAGTYIPCKGEKPQTTRGLSLS